MRANEADFHSELWNRRDLIHPRFADSFLNQPRGKAAKNLQRWPVRRGLSFPKVAAGGKQLPPQRAQTGKTLGKAGTHVAPLLASPQGDIVNARTGLPYPLDFQLAASEDPAQGFWDEAMRTRAFSELIALKVRTVGPLLGASFLFILGMSLLAGYAKPLMALKVVGAVNVGYLLVFLTYLLCWIVSLAYVRAANIQFDPQARTAASVARRGVRP